MSLEPNITRFGTHIFVPYSRGDGVPFGFSRIIGSGGLDLSGEIVTLQGGSSRYPWANAHGFIEPKMAVSFKEAPSWLPRLSLGTAPVIIDASAALVRNIMNERGSLFEAGGNFFNSITISDEGNAKFGKYTIRVKKVTETRDKDNSDIAIGVKVYVDSSGDVTTTSVGTTFLGYANEAAGASATEVEINIPTFNVHISSDIDAREGSNILTLFDDLLRINDEPIPMEDGANTVISVAGITVSIETVANGFDVNDFNNGDSFSFELIPTAEFYRETIIGRPSDDFPEFGAYMLTEKSGGRFTYIDAYRCKMNGMPMSITEKTFAESEISIMLIADGDRGICKMVDLVKKI